MDSIFLTGASTGIGRATALRLAKRDVVVFAGVRREADAQALVADGGDRIRPLYVEVTDAQSIAAARDAVAQSGTVLRGIINNAGVAVAGPLEVLSLQELRKQFEINFFAPVAIMQTFLPLLRATRGRIVNVSSIGGKFAAPFVGAYASSKFALEAASDSMRIELRPSGVKVVLVEPGGVKTPIWSRSTTASESVFDDAPPELKEAYAEMVANMTRIAQRLDETGIDADRVADAIERGLYAPYPRARYLVGGDARVRLLIARLPDGIRDTIVARVVGAKQAPRLKRM